MKLHRNRDWLIDQYINKKVPIYLIAINANVSTTTIVKWMARYNIKSKKQSGSYNGSWIDSPIKNYELLYREYIENRLGYGKVAKKYKVSKSLIKRLLKKHNIPTRSTVDGIKLYNKNREIKGPRTKPCPECKINTISWYHNGVCGQCYQSKRIERSRNLNFENITFSIDLREYTQRCWSVKVFERDGFVCQHCGHDRGMILQAHHIVPFNYIRDCIVLENAHKIDLSNYNGINKLYKIAIDDYRINDVNNGITLCKRCHKDEHKKINLIKGFDIYKYCVTITSVYDGDTFSGVVDLGFNVFKKETFRLYGVNCDELRSKDIHRKGMALRSRSVLSEILTIGRKVVVRTFKSGKYGRWLCIVDLDGIDYNKYIVNTGLAREYYF